MKHILPVPSWCVQTQSYAEHVTRAGIMGCCPKPSANCKCWYYGGLDLAPPWGRATEDVPIYASCNQTIKEIIDESPRGYGLNIRGTTPEDELIIYAHLSRTYVNPGQSVKAGDVIGLMGSTGNSTGKHLHWEIRVRGIPTDPRSLMGAVVPTPEPEPSTEFEPALVPDCPLVRVTKAITGYLNVRQLPVSGKVIGKLYPGDIVPMFGLVEDKANYWYAVILPDNTLGWAAAYYGGETWLEIV